MPDDEIMAKTTDIHASHVGTAIGGLESQRARNYSRMLHNLVGCKILIEEKSVR
jgi:hypothetical protein